MTGRWHKVGRHGSVPLLSLPVKDASRRQHLTGGTARGRAPWTRRPSSRSQSGMRAGDDIQRDDGATARGQAPWTRLPSSRSQSGMRAVDDICRDEGAMARGGAPWISSPPLAPSQGCKQETTFDGGDGTRPGAMDEAPLLSLSVRDASRRR